MLFRTKMCLLASSALLCSSLALAQNGNANPRAEEATANKVEHETYTHAKGNAGPPGGGSQIRYWGGPVMTGTNHIYYIWYGSWSATSKTILNNFALNIGASPYFNINTTYYQVVNNIKTSVIPSVTLAGAVDYPTYPHGKNLSDSDIFTIVKDALTSGVLPVDASGIYFVLTDPTVTATSGFCTQYCGWHTYDNYIGNVSIKYSFVGNPDRCPSACQAQPKNVSPNGDLGADGMVSIIAHELEEAVTDPKLNAWFDSRGYENADKCAWTFGTTTTDSAGAVSNITLGSLRYLIQRNWDAARQTCAMSR